MDKTHVLTFIVGIALGMAVVIAMTKKAEKNSEKKDDKKNKLKTNRSQLDVNNVLDFSRRYFRPIAIPNFNARSNDNPRPAFPDLDTPVHNKFAYFNHEQSDKLFYTLSSHQKTHNDKFPVIQEQFDVFPSTSANGSSNGTPSGPSIIASNPLWNRASNGPSNEALNGSSNEKSRAALNQTSERSSNGTSNDKSHGTSKKSSNGKSRRASNGKSKKSSNGKSNGASNEASVGSSNGTSNGTSNETSNVNIDAAMSIDEPNVIPNARYTPTNGYDIRMSNGRLQAFPITTHNIAAMKEYSGVSADELRCNYYDKKPE